MGKAPKKQGGYTLEITVAAGYIVFFCLAAILYITFLIFITTNSQWRPSQINVFATGLPPTTPTPHFSPIDQPDTDKLFEDDFTTNKNGWTLKREIFKEEVTDGKLYFESLIEDNYAFTGCKSCPNLKDPFYLQADFATTTSTDKSFGIIINLDYSTDSFYLFQINAESRRYLFRHHTAKDWSLRAAGESDQIKSYPDVNTLGIYVNQDTVEFYINGKIIDSYNQSGHSFQKGDFSFYVSNSNFKLVVDNLTIGKIGK